jgi:hypothetical protein
VSLRLRIKPSRNGSSFKYFIDYLDENGKRVRKSLGHADRKKAERQRAQFERELHMGIVEPDSMKLSDFLADCLIRTRRQVTEATLDEYDLSMRQFIEVTGDIDICSVQHMWNAPQKLYHF